MENTFKHASKGITPLIPTELHFSDGHVQDVFVTKVVMDEWVEILLFSPEKNISSMIAYEAFKSLTRTSGMQTDE